tara:strand:- start:1271 stop:1678 length:408 start_codon:yes stop_codon:yes gene_type:complete
MGKVGTFWHNMAVATDLATVGTGFLLAKRHDIPLDVDRMAGEIRAIRIRLKAVAGGATTLTLKVCALANGTQIITNDTTTPIMFNIGSSVAGSAIFDIELAHVQSRLPLPATISTFYKVDAGTVTVDTVEIIWSE